MTASSQMSLSEQSAALTLLGLSEFCEKKIENSARATCKFCTTFSWILRKFYALFQADFYTLKLAVAVLYDLFATLVYWLSLT